MVALAVFSEDEMQGAQREVVVAEKEEVVAAERAGAIAAGEGVMVAAEPLVEREEATP
jgi:hypothetical protein